ncbi:PREDICTED: protein LURP-one-related 13-like [Lupinus angustifolius]|uniref:protein LURP-one-related 13-like n=1 Tax=Lupinus angustifolius TaxID=3871 RepID=UPI00092E374C|nr:PREDICTED: protein LURP-one-related 13-like [Lupinus angustifolius]
MEDFSNVFEGGYNSGYHQINMRIDTEDGKTWSNDGDTFVIEKHFSHHFRRVLKNASSHEFICTMHKKKATAHGRWHVYKGQYNNCYESDELCFMLKRPKINRTQKNVELDVFLPKNEKERVCKVRVRDDICEIISASRFLAKAKMEESVMDVMIEANVDHAFIVSLLVIVDEIKHNKFHKVVKGVAKVTMATAKVAMVVAMAGINCP